MQIKKIGTFTTISNKYIICYDEEGEKTYFCKDFDSFARSSENTKQKQELTKYIEGVLFHATGVMIKCYADKITEEHLEKHTLGTTDEKLKNLVHFCAEADGADWETIRSFEKIHKWSELKNISSGLGAGLGFPGQGVGLLKVEQQLPFLPENYLQIVDSYMEGYSVRHVELNEELVRACNTSKVKNLFIENEEVKNAD